MTESASAPAKGKVNVGNVVVWVLLAAAVGAAVWWYGIRETPVVSVREGGNATGRFAVEGVVRPRLSAENLALRAAEYRGVALEYFEVEDDTGVLAVYVDPADAAVPPEGARVRVTGSRVDGSGGDFTGTRPFIASEVVRLE